MTTVYRVPHGGRMGANNAADAYFNTFIATRTQSTSETYALAKTYTASTFKNIRLNINSSSSSASSALTLLKNSSTTALSASIGAGSTGWIEDTSNSVSVASGDVVTLFMDRNDANNIVVQSMFVDILTTDATSTVSSTEIDGVTFATASATRYFPLIGTTVFSTAETSSKCPVPSATVAKNFGVYIISNARSSSTTFTLRKNGADTALTFTVGAGATGYFADTSNTVSYSAGDTFNAKMVTGTGTGNIEMSCGRVAFNNTSTGTAPCFATRLGTTNNTTRYCGIIGDNNSGSNTTESNVELLLRGTGTIRNLYALVNTNPVALGSDYTIRKNNSDTSVTINVPASTTGTFSDTTHSFTYADGDKIALKMVRGNSAGTLVLDFVSFEIAPDSETISGGFQSAWARNSNQIIGVMR